MTDYTYAHYCLKNDAYTVLRGINKAFVEYDWQKTDDTSIMDLAAQKANETENKSPLTIALEDFAQTTKGFDGSDKSCITPKDTQLTIFESFASIFGKEPDNIFKTDEGQEIVENYGSVHQNDLYRSDYAANNGIRYANEGDDLYESALNFAKADIAAIEKAYRMAHNDSDNNGQLNFAEVKSYADISAGGNVLEGLDLGDNKKQITAEEYASYLVAADQMGNKDGVISMDEAYEVLKSDNETFTSLAKSIYEEHYN